MMALNRSIFILLSANLLANNADDKVFKDEPLFDFVPSHYTCTVEQLDSARVHFKNCFDTPIFKDCYAKAIIEHCDNKGLIAKHLLK